MLQSGIAPRHAPAARVMHVGESGSRGATTCYSLGGESQVPYRRTSYTRRASCMHLAYTCWRIRKSRSDDMLQPGTRVPGPVSRRVSESRGATAGVWPERRNYVKF